MTRVAVALTLAALALTACGGRTRAASPPGAAPARAVAHPLFGPLMCSLVAAPSSPRWQIPCRVSRGGGRLALLGRDGAAAGATRITGQLVETAYGFEFEGAIDVDGARRELRTGLFALGGAWVAAVPTAGGALELALEPATTAPR